MKSTYFVLSIVFVCIHTLLAQTNLDSGLVAYWPFNGNAIDESGNGNDGGLHGGVMLAEDRFGNPNSAYEFDGIDGRIDYPLLWGSNQAPDTLTMVAWFNYAQTEDEGKIIYHGFTGEFQLLAIGDTAAAGVHLPSGWYVAHTQITQNNWHCLIGIWKRGERLWLFLDGELMDTTSVPDEPLGVQASLYFPSIGSYNQSSTAVFTGILDDIRIYNRELTSEEIDSLNTEGTSGVELSNATIPEEFKLWQNYPNPFNPSTKINFSIPEASFVSLKVFNSLGEEIETLVAKELSTGNYSYKWQAINLPSGIYFYKLQTGNFTRTKKMILLK